MLRAKPWFLIGLLSVSCIVPDVEVSGPTGDDGVSRPAPSAFGKFCNSVVADDQNVPMTLQIGTGSKKVLITADSGACKPISGTACAPIPVGSEVPVSLLFNGEAIVTYPVDFEDGAFWIFLAYTDGENVDVAGDSVTQDVCELGYDAPSAQ